MSLKYLIILISAIIAKLEFRRPLRVMQLLSQCYQMHVCNPKSLLSIVYPLSLNCHVNLSLFGFMLPTLYEL